MPKGYRSNFGVRIPEGGYCGIDPGAKGGIGYVTETFAAAWKLPETETDIWNLVRYVSSHAKMTILEKLHARYGNGVVQSFKLGQSFGELRMAITAAGCRRELVTPQLWQKTLRCNTKGDKNVTKRKAQELWPKLKITHAIADALLLAEYGRRAENLVLLSKS